MVVQQTDSLRCGEATAVAAGCPTGEDGFVCIFIPGGNENRGVAAIELAASNKSILELMETMCQETDMGFRTVRAPGKILVEFYQPEENQKTQ